VATLAWLLALAWLPVLGWAVYWWLGPQRIRRRRLKRQRARSAFHRAPLPRPGEMVADGRERLIEASTGVAPTQACRVDLITGGESTFEALFSAIAAARHSIHLEYYIFEPDSVGTRLRDLLAARARAGVAVRLLLDGLGSRRCSPRFLAPLSAAGAEVAWFHPLRLGHLVWRPTLNLRTHRKIAVIDGRIGFTGGGNISDSQSERASAAAFHDLPLRMEGEGARPCSSPSPRTGITPPAACSPPPPTGRRSRPAASAASWCPPAPTTRWRRSTGSTWMPCTPRASGCG
jgi:cardiolipin synthase